MVNRIARVLKALALTIIGFIGLIIIACGIQVFIWLLPAGLLVSVIWLLFQDNETNEP